MLHLQTASLLVVTFYLSTFLFCFHRHPFTQRNARCTEDAGFIAKWERDESPLITVKST